MNAKKIITLLLALLLVGSMAACSNKRHPKHYPGNDRHLRSSSKMQKDSAYQAFISCVAVLGEETGRATVYWKVTTERALRAAA